MAARVYARSRPRQENRETPKNPQKPQTGCNCVILRTTKRGLASAGFRRDNFDMKQEFAFQIEQDDNMLVATCHEPEMATQGENLDELLAMIRDLIRCRIASS